MQRVKMKVILSILMVFCVIGSIHAENEDERLIKEELVKYYQSTDTDEDHLLTIDELAKWIRNIHNIIIDDNVNSQWANVDKEITQEHTWTDYEVASRETVNWKNYKKRIYEDHLLEHQNSNEKIKRPVEEIEKEFNEIVSRFEKRWNLADEDGTGYLVKEEFKYYLHPEESNNETVLSGAIEDLRDDLDRNHDGTVSFEEYFDHIKSISSDEEKKEPEFYQVNKENFELNLDNNKNGLLDLDEIKAWMIPDYNKFKMEAANLMEQTDLNGDNELQLEELIDGFEKFYNLLPPRFYETLSEIRAVQPPVTHDEF